jgi:plastocyanin
MNKSTLSLGALVLLSGLVMSACIKKTQPAATPEPTAIPAQTETIEQATSPVPAESEAPSMQGTSEESKLPADTTDASVIKLTADNFTFGRDEIRVKKGQKLTLSITNAEGFHDLKIDELKVNTGMIPAGQTKDVEIPTDKPGTYEYYCSVGNHRAQGMKGTLIIE